MAAASLCFHRPGSVPTTGRKDRVQRRPTSGAVAQSGRAHSGRASPRNYGKLELAVNGATSLPCMTSVGVPELRVCNLSGPSGDSAFAERPHGSKMMGTLASAFTGPLKDCNSFRRLRDAVAHIISRTLNSPGHGYQLPRHQHPSASTHDDSITDASQLSDPPSPSNRRLGEELCVVYDTSSCVPNGDVAVRQALTAATTRQCCRLLRRGWETVDAALQSVPILAWLRDDGLLNPLVEVQAAILDCLLDLLSKAAGSVQQISKPKPGSFAAWTDPEASQTDVRAKSTARPVSAIQMDVQKWVQEAKVFGRLSELNLLPGKGLQRASHLLEAELRRILRAPTPQDLRRVAQRLAEGGLWLARANDVVGGRRQEGFTIESHDKSISARPDSLSETVREIVVTALRTSTESDRDGPAALAAREALQRCGLVDINEEFPDCSATVSRGPRRCSSAPEFGQTLPGLHNGARRGKQTPTVLESGLWQLEAAKAIIRENRLSPAGMQSRVAYGGRR